MILVVNFKTYEESIGERGLQLAKIIESITKNAIVCPQTPDLRYISNSVEIPVYAQHVDNIEAGSHTGWILPKTIKDCGCHGALINHSEHGLSIEGIEERIKLCKEIGLKTIVCVPDINTEEKIVGMEPDVIAIEPPELIGGTVSVATARPELIEKAVETSRGIPVYCGAGIKDGDDIKIAKQLGAKGILISSGIVKSKDPETILKAFANYL